ncbi:MAG: hypothetical protein K8H74_04410 [Notoacmeibacter sp.]|nr:hypothetical protein [Notoacmeibacter sp.]
MSDDDFRLIPRASTEAERRRLKSATEQAVKMAGGADFEPHTRVKKAALSKYGGMAEPDHFIPLDVILELDRHNGAPVITGVLARMQGFELRPIAAQEEDELQLGDAQAIAKETGDVVNLLLGLLTSGKRLDAADRRDLMREVAEAKATLYRLAAKVGGGA